MKQYVSMAAAAAGLCLAAGSAGAASSLPGAVEDASGDLGVKPPAIVLSRDGSQYFGGRSAATGKINWTRWSSTGAAGTGYFQRNDCDPACADGRFTAYPVQMILAAPRRSHGKLLFTQFKLHFTGAVPSGYHRSETLTAKYTGVFYWQ